MKKTLLRLWKYERRVSVMAFAKIKTALFRDLRSAAFWALLWFAGLAVADRSAFLAVSLAVLVLYYAWARTTIPAQLHSEALSREEALEHGRALEVLFREGARLLVQAPPDADLVAQMKWTDRYDEWAAKVSAAIAVLPENERFLYETYPPAEVAEYETMERKLRWAVGQQILRARIEDKLRSVISRVYELAEKGKESA